MIASLLILNQILNQVRFGGISRMGVGDAPAQFPPPDRSVASPQTFLSSPLHPSCATHTTPSSGCSPPPAHPQNAPAACPPLQPRGSRSPKPAGANPPAGERLRQAAPGLP